MSRSRIIVQGALACALMLAGITTVFVRSGDDDVATPPVVPTSPAVSSPLPSLDASPSAKPAPAPRATVKPRAPLTKQEAAPIGVFKIWQPSKRTPPRAEQAPQPVTCEILAKVRETVDGTLITPRQAKAQNLLCLQSATLVRVYRQASVPLS